MRKDRTLQKPETRSPERAPARVLFINVFEGIRRKEMFKQTFTPWINRTLKDQQKCWIWKNPKIMLQGLDVTSIYSPPRQLLLLSKFYFSAMSPARFSQWAFLIGDYGVESHLGDTGGKKKESAAKCWFQTPQNGRVSSQDCPWMCSNCLCTSVLQTHSPWKEANTTWRVPSSQSSQRGLMS